MTKLNQVARTALAVVFGAIVTAACSSAPAAAPTSATAAKPAAATPAALTRVRISHAGAQTFRLPLYVAIQNGYFKDEGLDAEVIETKSGSDAMKMLAGKAVEFSTGQLVDAVNLNKEGMNIQGVAMLTNKLGNSIVVRKSLANDIKSMADLKGPNRTVGVTSVGSGTWQFAVYAAQAAGLKPEDLNFIPLGTGGAVIGGVQAGRVDAMSFADPENFQLVESGDAVFLIDMTDEATHKKLIGDTYLNNQIMVSSEYIKQKPEVVQSFVNAIQRGSVWASAHTPEEIATLILGYEGFKGADQALMVKSLRRMATAIPKSTVITRDAFDNAMKLPVAIGVIDKPMSFEQLVDSSFAEKAAAKYPAGS
jgi:NitT/TauT family transport system substrate-binding protein